jgi:amino-acid racemase
MFPWGAHPGGNQTEGVAMKTIGLLGGMSWESTQTYYRLLNEAVRERLGGLHSARLLLYSVDFAEIEALQKTGDWDRAANILSGAARALEKAGAECLLICTNTMHKVAPQVAQNIDIPLLHIMDAVGESVRADGLDCVGFLGTRFTMEEDFCIERLASKGLRVLVPGESERERIHRVIFEELCLGVVEPGSRELFLGIIEELRSRGAQGIILGCTEIGLLISPGDTEAVLYDTTELHVDLAVGYALDSE